MKLTKDDKDAFVRAVMDDVPKVDYDAQVRDIAHGFVRDKLPKELILIWDSPKLRPWMRNDHWNTISGTLNSLSLPVDISTDKFYAAIQHLAKKADGQASARSDLKTKLRATINACSTLKQAKERLPEFEKYLPADRDGTGTANLPAVANIVAELTKAGWPKGAKQ